MDKLVHSEVQMMSLIETLGYEINLHTFVRHEILECLGLDIWA